MRRTSGLRVYQPLRNLSERSRSEHTVHRFSFIVRTASDGYRQCVAAALDSTSTTLSIASVNAQAADTLGIISKIKFLNPITQNLERKHESFL